MLCTRIRDPEPGQGILNQGQRLYPKKRNLQPRSEKLDPQHCTVNKDQDQEPSPLPSNRIEDTLGMMDFQGEAVFFLKINIFGGAQYNF